MASIKMDINRLKKDELIYELTVRGIGRVDTKTVDELRSCLRSLLKLEKSNTSLSYPEYTLDVASELKVIADKYSELRALHDKLLAGTFKQSPEVIRSRLCHIINRLDRVPVASLASEQLQVRSDLLANVLELLDALDSFETPADNSGLDSIFAGPSTPTALEVDIVMTDPPVLDSTHVSSSSFSSQPVQKWNLKFSGDVKGISVHNFLERVYELRVARNVSEQQLIESAVDLFEGKALLWYRSNKYRISSWSELCQLLLKHYEPPDYKDRLFEEILSRTQDPSESFIDYFSCMLSMFRRYGKVSEDIQLRIITKNLAPFYTSQLCSVTSLTELENECLKLERKKFRVDNFRPPCRRNSSLVEPDFAFTGTSSSRSTSRPIAANAVQANNLNCYNCGEPGHAFRNCQAARTMFCYKCGRRDVTVNRCPNCRRPENRPGRH